MEENNTSNCRKQVSDVHITMYHEIPKFRYHHFSGDFGPLEHRIFQLLKTQE